MWFDKSSKENMNNIRLKAIEDRLNKLECDHDHDLVFSLHNGGPYWKKECWGCRKVLVWYDNEKDYLTARNVYMADLITKNEKIILDMINGSSCVDYKKCHGADKHGCNVDCSDYSKAA